MLKLFPLKYTVHVYVYKQYMTKVVFESKTWLRLVKEYVRRSKKKRIKPSRKSWSMSGILSLAIMMRGRFIFYHTETGVEFPRCNVQLKRNLLKTILYEFARRRDNTMNFCRTITKWIDLYFNTTGNLKLSWNKRKKDIFF